MKQKCWSVFALLLLVFSLSACVPVAESSSTVGATSWQEDSDMSIKENHYRSSADFYLPFEDGSSEETEVISKQKIVFSYAFSAPEYTRPSSFVHRKGVRGQAALFDGYSTSGEFQEFALSKAGLGLSLWVAPRCYEKDYAGKWTDLLSSQGGIVNFELGIANYGRLAFSLQTSRGTFKVYGNDENGHLDLYQWNHVGVSFSSATGEITLYKNGVLVGSASSGEGQFVDSKVSLSIGQNPLHGSKAGVATNTFSGLIDEVEIFSSPLSSEKVRALFSEPADGKLPSLNVEEDLWLNTGVLAEDRYCPQYHLRVPQNWQNESYGYFFYEGKYHAFCQQNSMGPYYNDGARWGHFVSEDLVHWKNVVPALIPEENGVDNDACFSGSAGLDASGKPILFYTGVVFDGEYVNLISSARPHDLSDPSLKRWDKKGAAIIAQGDLSTKLDFRDPYFYQEEGESFLFIGGHDKASGNGCIYAFKATDDSLENWRYLGETYRGDKGRYPELGTFYEMPNLGKIRSRDGTLSKYVLFFSPIGGSRNGAYYLLGDFNKTTGVFTPEDSTPLLADQSPASTTLCPSLFNDVAHQRTLLSTMMRTGFSDADRLASGWSGVTTLFKELYLAKDGTLRFHTIDEYSSLNAKTEVALAEGNLSLAETNTSFLKDLPAMDQYHLTATIRLGGAQKVGIYFKEDVGGDEKCSFAYDASTGETTLDLSKASLASRSSGISSVGDPAAGDTLTFDLFVDRSLVEASLNEKTVMSGLACNTAKKAVGIRVFFSGGSPVVERLIIEHYQGAYRQEDAYWGQ